MLGLLPLMFETRAVLVKRNIISDSSCPLCSNGDEWELFSPIHPLFLPFGIQLQPRWALFTSLVLRCWTNSNLLWISVILAKWNARQALFFYVCMARVARKEFLYFSIYWQLLAVSSEQYSWSGQILHFLPVPGHLWCYGLLLESASKSLAKNGTCSYPSGRASLLASWKVQVCGIAWWKLTTTSQPLLSWLERPILVGIAMSFVTAKQLLKLSLIQRIIPGNLGF